MDPSVVNLARAIRKREGGDYNNYTGDNATSAGAYQWSNYDAKGNRSAMKPGAVPSLFKEQASKYGLDPNDFSPKNQDMVAYNHFKSLKDSGKNVIQIAAIHNGGDENRWDPNYVTKSGLPSQKAGVYDVPAYAKAVNDEYQRLKQATGGDTQPQEDISSILKGQYTQPETPSGMTGTGEVTPAGLATELAGSVYNPAVKMGLGVANYGINPIIGREDIKNLPSFENITGDKNAPGITAPGYDQQGNYLGPLNALEQGVGAAGMTALNVASLGKGKAVTEGLQGAGKYAVGKVGGPLSSILGAGLREVPMGLGYGATGAMSEGGDTGDVLASTAAGGALAFGLGAGLRGGSMVAAKMQGIDKALLDKVNALELEGKTAEADAIKASPEYKKLLTANGVDDATIDTAVKDNRAAVREFVNEGVDRSKGKAQVNRAAELRGTDDAAIDTLSELSAPATNGSNPLEGTFKNIEARDRMIADASQPVLDSLRKSGVQLGDINPSNVTNMIVKELKNSGVIGGILKDSEPKIAQLIQDQVDLAQSEGRVFDVADLFAIKRQANKFWENENTKGAVNRAIGNTMRSVLKRLESSAKDDTSKKIVQHLNQLDKAWSNLYKAEQLAKLISTVPGKKPSALLNMLGGALATGGGYNPLAYISGQYATQLMQDRIAKSGANRILDPLSGKVRGMTTSRLIGNSKNVLKLVEEKATARKEGFKAAKEAAKSVKENAQAQAKKESSINALLKTITPKRDSQLPVIDMGPKPVSKYAAADSKLPIAEGAPKVHGDLSAETKSYMEMYEKNGVKTEPLSSESFGEKDRQKIINFLNKQPDAVVLAEREKLSNLIDGHKAIIDHMEGTGAPDVIKRLNKLTDKKGEFKGELNLNNAKGNLTKNNDAYLREVFGDNNNKYSAEELAKKFYDLKESYTNAKALLKDLKSQFKNLKSGSLPGFTGQKELGIMAALAPLGIMGAKKLSSMGKETYTRDQAPKEEPVMKPVVNEQPAAPKGVIDGIDIRKYATDPEHEVKVEKIHASLPEIATSTDAQKYIDTIKSKYGHDIKVTGDMIYKAAKEYNVSMKLMIALMQNDSMFGTTGLGKKTNNPGNIANDDAGHKQYYPTMREGVRAVARQLSRYKSRT